MSPRAQVMLYMENPEEANPPYFPKEVAVELRFFESGRGLIFEPLRPLKPSTRYGLILKAIPPQEDREGCIAPSDLLSSLLDIEQSPRLASRRIALLERAEIKPTEVAAMTVFTTQSATEIARKIAQNIREQSYAWRDDLVCNV